jgi:hypothetical protein
LLDTLPKHKEPDSNVGGSFPHQLTPCANLRLSTGVSSEHLKKVALTGEIIKHLSEKGDTIVDTQNVDNYERREYFIEDGGWRLYTFPKLDFIGIWNDSAYSSIEYVHAEHLGVHVHLEDIKIRLPHSIVNGLGAMWAHIPRDLKRANFNLTVSRCKNITRCCAISAEEERIVNLYAPSIAYSLFWEEEQQVSRVTFKRYLTSNIRTSLNKSLVVLRYFKRWILLFSILMTASALISVRLLRFLFNYRATFLKFVFMALKAFARIYGGNI